VARFGIGFAKVGLDCLVGEVLRENEAQALLR
jgi:hypothetical protein